MIFAGQFWVPLHVNEFRGLHAWIGMNRIIPMWKKWNYSYSEFLNCSSSSIYTNFTHMLSFSCTLSKTAVLNHKGCTSIPMGDNNVSINSHIFPYDIISFLNWYYYFFKKLTGKADENVLFFSLKWVYYSLFC